MSKKGFEGFTKEWMTTKRPQEAREQLWRNKPQSPSEAQNTVRLQENGVLSDYLTDGNPPRYVFNIIPVPKPRMTRSDKWKKRACVMKYRVFADEMRMQARKINFELPEKINIEFQLPIPKGIPSNLVKVFEDQPHQVRPDLDNLIKAVQDLFLKEDSRVYEIHAKKVWGIEGKITIW